MRQQCIDSVQQAIGRVLKQPEIKDIENRISRNMRQLAQTDQQWQAKSAADRMLEAGQKAADELKAEAAKNKQRVALTILAHDRVNNLMQQYPDNPLEAIDRLLAFRSDGNNVQSIESASRAIRDEAMSRMLEAIEMTKGRLFGLLANEEGTTALVRELHGQDSGVPEAKVAAKQFQDVAESLRQRFNRAGGDIGKLDDWSIPRSHSQLKVAKSTSQWVEDHLSWLDRSRYVKEDGSRMSDAEVREFLEAASLTVATGGVNKLEPGRPAVSGMRANRGNESRQIHYKDAESYIAAQARYGDRNLMDLMFGHVDGISRDIALVETLGPNPNHAMRFFTETAYKQAVEKSSDRKGRLNKQVRRLGYIFDEVAGTRLPPASAAMANFFDTYRGINVSSRLGSAVITTVTDQGTLALTAKMNGMPVMQVLQTELKMINPANDVHRRMATRAGLGIDQLMGSMARWGADGLGHDAEIAGRASKFSQTAATKILQISGMNALDASSRRSFGAVMMDATGHLTRKHDSLSSLEASDQARLKRMGITERDWQVWRLADTEDWRGVGDTVLTSGSIYRIPDASLDALAKQYGTSPQRLKDQSATKLLGSVLDETNMAIPAPGARERAFMTGGLNRGEWGGELGRSFWQFKSFSVSMIMKHWRRAMSQQTGIGKAGYIASMVASTTVLGAVALQLNEIASGRDPKDMTDDGLGGIPGLRFALAAMMKGGALSLYGDFLFSDTTQGGQELLAAIGGPIGGDIEALYKLKDSAADLEVDKTGAKLIRFAKSHTPGANLWYTKAATDHLIFHQLQEYFSPGYLNNMQMRAQREFRQSFWWEPGQVAPRRAPDVGAVTGGR